MRGSTSITVKSKATPAHTVVTETESKSVVNKINAVTSAHAVASAVTAIRSPTAGMGAGTPRSWMSSTRTGTAVTLSATPTNTHACSELPCGPTSWCSKGHAAAAQTTIGAATQGTSCQSGDRWLDFL